jgi:hypothetical protein
VRRSRRTLPLLLALLSTPLAADVWEYGEAECNELWFMRNLIMDRAGYCFGTPLGQALFDNGDCRGKEVTPSAAESRQVQKIQTLEREIGCEVDTGSSRLDLPNMAALRRLKDMPLPDNGEAACIGWMGEVLPLYDGYGAGAAEIGQIRPGDTISYSYIGEGDWTVVTVSAGGFGGPVVQGWIDIGAMKGACAQEAG